MPAEDEKPRSLYPLAALVRVFLFHELSGKPIDGILNRLEENPDEAAAFGFEDVSDTYGAGDVPDQHFRIPLVVRPKPKGVPQEILVRELYWRARELVAIEEAYLDAGFYAAGVLWSLNETGSNYVVSAQKGKRLKRWEQRNLQTRDVAV